MLVYFLFVIGLIGLMAGGDFLVKGSVGIAEKFAIPPLIIGLTIVAFGTSAPELVISLDAALTGAGELAVGNVVGSNIANVLLVLGIPALITPMVASEGGIKRTVWFLTGVTILFVVQLFHDPVTRVDGAVLLVCLAVFLLQQASSARSRQDTASTETYKEEIGKVPQSWLPILALTLAGLVLLPLGAKLTVDAAVEIAQRWDVPKSIVGLTVVAIGTSLPELATGIMAARQGQTSVALGNVIGSNFFNIAAIMGITALVIPVPVGDHILGFDVWVMFAVTVLLVMIAVMKLTIGRMGGLFMTALYLAYLAGTVSI